MKVFARNPFSVVVVSSLLMSACATQEQTGQLVGTVLASGLCLALIDHRHQGACLAATVAGFLAGGAIGRQLDERDRERRKQALLRTLNDDQLWAGRQGTAPLPESEVNAKPISYAPPRGDTVTPTGTEWHNPDTDDSGRIEPLRTYVGGAQRNEKCRQFRETYFKNGEPVVATEQACQNAQGQWQ